MQPKNTGSKAQSVVGHLIVRCSVFLGSWSSTSSSLHSRVADKQKSHHSECRYLVSSPVLNAKWNGDWQKKVHRIALHLLEDVLWALLHDLAGNFHATWAA